MKIDKKTFIILIANLVILPLLGNEALNNYLHINVLVTILNYILPFLLIFLLIVNMIKEKRKPKIEPTLFITGLFWIILIISFIFSITHQIFNFSNLYKFICMTFLLLVLKDIEFDDKQRKTLCYSILGISTFIALIGIGQYIFKINLNTAGIEKYIGALGRINSTTYIATLLDKYMALNILLILYFIYKKYTNFYISIFALIINILALTFTFSRTGLLIFIFISIMFIIIYFIKKQFVNAIILIILTIGIYFIPGQNFVFSSLANYIIDVSGKISETINIPVINITTKKILAPLVIDINDYIDKNSKTDEKQEIDDQLINGTDYSLNSRNYYKSVAKAILKEHWQYGIGIGSYTFIHDNQNANNYLKNHSFKEEYGYPHSMFFQLGAETGIFGLILFFSSIIYTLLNSAIKNKTVFPIILLIAILLMCYTETIFYMKEMAYFTIISITLFGNKSFLKKLC